MTRESLSEDAVIAALSAAAFRRADVEVGIGDDGAVLEVPAGKRLVTVMDTLVAGVHFPHQTAAADVGYRALAVNLSDLAAMGAAPAWSTLSLTLPDANPEWVNGFARGWREIADEFSVSLVGGDTVRGPLSVSVALHGFASAGRILMRGGACAGDLVFLTGMPGEAAAGLALLTDDLTAQHDGADSLKTRFHRPTPRVPQGMALAGLASAAIDVSDGLVKDAQRLAAASGVAIQLNAGHVPLSAELVRTAGKKRALQLALAGGDDYELLFTIRPAILAQLEAASSTWNCGCTRIGTVSEGAGVQLMHEGRPMELPAAAFEHFSPTQAPAGRLPPGDQ